MSQQSPPPPKKRRMIDPHPPPEMFKYALTLTDGAGLLVHEDAIIQWHKRKSDKTLLVSELHQDGRTHYHSIIYCKSKQACAVTRMLKTLYKDMGLEWTFNSVVVKRVTDEVGMYHYLCKDIPPGGVPVYIHGWLYSWIKSECVANVKNIPRKLLTKDNRKVLDSEASRVVIAWAKAAGHPLTGKLSFVDVIHLMRKEGYQFSGTKFKWLYGDVMAMTGNDDLSKAQLMDALFGLD